MKPKFVDRKKHFNEVLVMGDRRKLLETAQDMISEAGRVFPKPFLEVFSKRCIRSMHLFSACEMAIIARALDVHDVNVPGIDVYGPLATRVLKLTAPREGMPGVAISVFADVLPRRLLYFSPEEKTDLLRALGKCASKAMWEIEPAYAVHLLRNLTNAGVRDTALCRRVARKVVVHLDFPGALELHDIADAATVFAIQKHRDLELFAGLAARAAKDCQEYVSPDGAAAAAAVLDAFTGLEIEMEAASTEELRRAAAQAVDAAPAAGGVMGEAQPSPPPTASA